MAFKRAEDSMLFAIVSWLTSSAGVDNKAVVFFCFIIRASLSSALSSPVTTPLGRWTLCKKQWVNSENQVRKVVWTAFQNFLLGIWKWFLAKRYWNLLRSCFCFTYLSTRGKKLLNSGSILKRTLMSSLVNFSRIFFWKKTVVLYVWTRKVRKREH